MTGQFCQANSVAVLCRKNRRFVNISIILRLLTAVDCDKIVILTLNNLNRLVVYVFLEGNELSIAFQFFILMLQNYILRNKLPISQYIFEKFSQYWEKPTKFWQIHKLAEKFYSNFWLPGMHVFEHCWSKADKAIFYWLFEKEGMISKADSYYSHFAYRSGLMLRYFKVALHILHGEYIHFKKKEVVLVVVQTSEWKIVKPI